MNVRLTDAASHARCGASSAKPAARAWTRTGWAALLAAALVSLPGVAAAQTAAPGDRAVNLTWTAPGGSVQVLILARAGAAVADAPVNGTSYQPFTFNSTLGRYEATTLGASTVVFAGTANLTSVTSLDGGVTLLANGTTYFFRLFSKDAAGVYTALPVAPSATPVSSSNTVITNLGDPASAPLNPGSGLTVLDGFGLSNLNGDTVTSATISLQPPDVYAALQTVSLTTAAGAVIGTPVTNPTSNVITFPGLTLPVTSVTTTYNIRIQPKAHVDMPAPPGKSYAVTGVLASIVSGKPRSGSDSAGTTLTIDNASPADPTTFTGTPASTTVALSWVNPAADFAGVLVLRNTASITDRPVEGNTTYVAGGTIGTSTIVTVGTAQTGSASGLTNGTGYYFKIFARDALGNYSVGSEIGPVIPGSSTTAVGNTVKGTKAPVVAIVNPLGGSRLAPTRKLAADPILIKVQARVFSPSASVGAVQLRRYTTNPATAIIQPLTQNTRFGVAPTSGIWETPAGFALPAGTWNLDVQATSVDGVTISNPVSVTVVDTVPATGVPPQAGDGHLLVRDNSPQLCGDCHALASHNSENGNTNYGSWSTACRDCHTPHGTKNVFIVAETITPPQRGAGGATLPKPVAFSNTDATGTGDATAARTAASYVNTDNTGPCQVCHTLTKYYRADGSSPGGAGHQTGTRCTNCHPHSQGMAVNCTACHGTAGRPPAAGVAGTDPLLQVAPPNGAHGETLTSQAAVGAHQAHVNNTALRATALACSECHPPSNHNGTVDILFGALGNGTTASVPLSPVYNADSTCSSTWCHGNGLNAGGTNNTPTWTSVGTGQAACGTCHGAPPTVGHPANSDCNLCHPGYATTGLTAAAKATHIDGVVNRPGSGSCTGCHGSTGNVPVVPTPPGVNAADIQIAPPRSSTGSVAIEAHTAHVNKRSVPVACGDCHGALPVDLTHMNGTKDVTLIGSALANLGGGFAVYTAGATPTCNAVYCHGATFPAAAKGTNTAPAWTDVLTCGSCHGQPPGDALHASVGPALTGCNACHPQTVDAAGNIIAVNGTHVNGIVESKFTAATSCTDCHGASGKTAGPQVATFFDAAPQKSIGGATVETDVKVGVHAAHVNNGVRARAVECEDCHYGSAAFDPFSPNFNTLWLHANGTVEVVFAPASAAGFISQARGATAAYARGTTFTCTNYCHGTTTPSQAWNNPANLTCTSCHLAPPAYSAAGNWHVQNTNCGTCHIGFTSTTVTGTAAVTHVDGKIDLASTLGCGTCHGDGSAAFVATDGATSNTTSNRVGAHTAHAVAGPVAAAIACTACHGTLPTAMGHASGAINIAWNSLASTGFTPTPAAGTIPVNTAQTCANYCHGSTLAAAEFGGTNKAPSWTGGAAAAACGTCHFSTTVPATSTLHPKTDSGGATITALTQCVQCHPDTMNATGGTINFAAGFHINGVVDVTGAHASPFAPAAHSAAFFASPAACTGCHGTDFNTTVATVGVNAMSCNSCHANPTLFNSSGAYTGGVANAQWGTDCTFCHGDTAVTKRSDPAYATAGTPAYNLIAIAPPQAVTDGVTSTTVVQVGAHQKHFTTTSAPKVACQACHGPTLPSGATAAAVMVHVNGTVALGWNTVATGNGAVTPTPSGTFFSAAWEASPTCTNYCHGSNLGAGGTATSPRWTVAADGACGACHFTTGATSVAGSTHASHTNNAAVIGTNFICQDCHSTVVNATGALLAAASTLHVNGTDNVSMLARGAQSNGTYAAGGCAASYCHSSGQATPVYRSIAWTAAPIGCNGCHGTGNAAGAPDYVTGGAGTASANSHASHTGAGASTCQDCHSGFVTAAGTAISGTSHINGSRDVAIRLALDTNGTTTSNYNTASKTCSAVSCHGTGAPVWGGAALKCSDCHTAAGTGADVDSFAFGTAGVISTTEWTNSGHGQAAGAIFTAGNVLPTIAAGQPCLYCHDSSIAHDVAGNPFRLHGATIAGGTVVPGSYNAAGPNAGNDVCLNCHSATGAGIAPNGQALHTASNKTTARHVGAKHGAGNDGGTRCWDCHDPHGDANIRMVGKKVIRDSNDLYGFSATRVPATGTMSFTADTARTNFVNASFTGICQACHTTALHFSQTLNEETTHNPTGGLCITCHTHEQPPTSAFASGASHASPYPAAQHSVDFVANQTSCQACHGATYATLVTTSGGSASCNTCHANPSAFNASGAYTGGVANANWQTDCTFCHGSTATAADAAYATAGTPARNLNQIAPPQAFTDGVTSTTFVQVGAHQKHFTTTSAPKVQCAACHGATVPPDLTHANGSIALGWSTVSTGNGAVSVLPAAFNATWEATPTCTNYCHGGAGSGLSGGTITAPRWTVAADGACGTCHFATNTAAPTAVATENHFNHVNNAAVIGTNFVCQDCHSTVVNATGALLAAASTLHVNGTDTVSMLPRGAQSNGSYVAGSCAASYCHSSGQATPTYRTIAWNSATDLGCNGCHGTGNAAGAPDYATGGAGTASANSHTSHTGAGASTCQDCHNGLVTAAGTAISGALHINGTREVVIRAALDTNGTTTSNYNTASKTCSAVSCHGSGNPVWGGAALKCSDCHAAAGTGADVDSFAFGTAGVISTSEWVTSGHGQPAAIAGGSQIAFGANALPTIAAGQPCLYCHDSGTAHDVATNPFRLLGASSGTGTTFAAYNGGSASNGNEVCLNCHGTGSVGVNAASQGLRTSTLKIDSWHAGAKHVTNVGGRRCWDCHDPHGDGNIQMVGKRVVRTSADNYSFSATRVPATGTLSFTARATGTDFANASGTGVCNVCHTAGNVGHYTSTAGDGHNSGAVCTSCHTHDQPTANVAFAVPAGGGSCISCHTTGGPAVPGRRDVVAEFKQAWSHKASSSATPANRVVTDLDCAVCHMEGDPTTGATTSFHSGAPGGVINLRDPDTGLHIKGVTFTAASGTSPGFYTSTAVDLSFTQFRRNLASATLEPAVQAIMINQCLKCHDANGAAVTRIPAANGGSAEKPFGMTIAGAGYVGAGVTANGVQGGVTDINSAFATTNSSYHPVRGAQNNWYAKLTRMAAPWNGATRGTSVNTTSWGPVISCWDCHAPNGTASTVVLTATVTAHGGATTLRGTPAVFGTVSTTNKATLCTTCHALYDSSASSNHGANSAFTSGTDGGMTIYLQNGCNFCHSSFISTTATAARPARGMDVHGTNTLPTTGFTKTTRWLGSSTGTPAQVEARPFAFIRNTSILTNHNPAKIGGSTYSASCSTPGTGRFTSCNNGMGSYTVGGTY